MFLNFPFPPGLDGWSGLFIFIKPLIISGIYSHSAEASHYEEASVSARQRNVSFTKHYAFCRVQDGTNFHLNTDKENTVLSTHTTLIFNVETGNASSLSQKYSGLARIIITATKAH